MAARIHELRTKRAAKGQAALAALARIRAAAQAEDRVFTPEESAEMDGFQAEIAELDTQIAAEEQANDLAARFGAASGSPRVDAVRLRAEDDPQRGFSSHREFFLSVIDNSGLRDRAQVADERLAPLAVADREDKQASGELAFLLPSAFAPQAAAGSDEQGTYSDPHGGFAVPTSRAPGMLSVGFEGDPTAGRTRNIPMATPAIEIMARTDKDHSTSVAGGFTVTRRPETAAATVSRMELEMITMKAASLFGLAYTSEELLTDSAVSFAALIDAGFRSQFGAHILNEKIRGGGGNEYLGYLNSPAKIAVAKETNQVADTIVAANVIKMAARCWGFGNSVWVANHDTRPQLAVLSIAVGTGGVLIYQPSARDGFPDMLWGRPVLYTEYASTVGDEGDLSLVNFGEYLEGTYQPIQGAESIHVRFVNHERTFKLWTRNAGAPWWRSPLTPNKGATLSPIVTLAARA